MNTDGQSEVQLILALQEKIEQRLQELGFVYDPDGAGNIIHHLAEVAVMGKKLADETLPAFLALPPDRKEQLGELIVGVQYELVELKEAIADMEPALIKLMNFLTEEKSSNAKSRNRAGGPSDTAK